MTDRKELESLKSRAASRGVVVEIDDTEEGGIEVRVRGAKGIGPFPMPPIRAAERLREWCADHGC